MRNLVYLIQHATGLQYVGITQATVKNRWCQHRREARKGGKSPLHRALRQFPDGWTVRKVQNCPDRETACQSQRQRIAALRQSNPDQCLNRQPGGSPEGPRGGRFRHWTTWLDSLSVHELRKIGRHCGWDRGGNRPIDVITAEQVIGRKIKLTRNDMLMLIPRLY